jgi:hypothetical protein
MREFAMDWSSGLSWLAALASRRTTRCEVPDRADMGTAFGLDASMVGTQETGPEALPGLARTPLQTWERRVVRRSGL